MGVNEPCQTSTYSNSCLLKYKATDFSSVSGDIHTMSLLIFGSQNLKLTFIQNCQLTTNEQPLRIAFDDQPLSAGIYSKVYMDDS